MYVKLLDQSGPSRIYEVGGEHVEFGSSHWWHYDGGPPHEAKLDDLLARLRAHGDVYDRTLIDPEPTGFKDGEQDKPFWKVRWVRFRQVDADAVRMVMSTAPIYILGENGKTIDRVR